MGIARVPAYFFKGQGNLLVPPADTERASGLHLFQVLLSILLLCCASLAQVALGTPNFSAIDAHTYESVSLLDNNILLSAPGMSKAGAMPFGFTLAANSSMEKGLNVSGAWGPTMANLIGTDNGAPFSASVNGALGAYGSGFYAISTYQNTQTCYGRTDVVFSYGWEIVDGNGTVHPLPFGDYVVDDTNCQTTFTDTTIDNSGYVATINSLSLGEPATIYGRDGTLITLGTSPSLKDRNGNVIAYSYSGNEWTDSMGLTTLTSTGGTAPSYEWTDVNGGTPKVSQTTTNLTLETNFGCSGITELNNSSTTPMTTGIALADNTSLAYSYEGTPSHTGKYTGRIYQVTFPQGGYARYTYSGGSNGIDCTYQNPPTLTRTLGNGDTTTYTLTHNLISGTNYNAVNKVVDPGGNETDYTFTGFSSTGAQGSAAQVLTQVVKYQGNGSSKTLLETDYYCYNTAFSSCSQSGSVGATVTYPIAKIIVFRQLSGMTNWAATETHYDSYGDVTYSARYDFGGSSPALATSVTYGSCTASCTTLTPTITSIGSHISDRPGEVVTTQNGSTVAQANYTYDSHGNLLSGQLWNGSSFIGQTTNNSYNANGTIATSYDLANNKTTYSYSPGSYVSCGSCTQYPFATSITKGGLTTSATYNGIGGAKVTDVDASGNTISYCYNTGANCSGGTADPYWRVVQTIDPYGSTVVETYPSGSHPDTVSSSFTFNSGNSINSTTVTTDGYGRPINSQTAQSPSGSQYDTVSASYGWSTNYHTVATSQPCSTTSGGSCTTVHTFDIDPLGRLYTSSTTSNETQTHTYAQNDDLAVLTPAPTGENAKQVQNEFDGLGRPTKSCAISSTVSGKVTCGENSGTSSGILTTVAYSSSTGSQTVTVSRGPSNQQQHTVTTDGLGRTTQKYTPEGGTWNYTYDTACSSSYINVTGRLAKVVDPNGNTICYSYDTSGRLTLVNADGTACRHFYYDNSSGYDGVIPTGPNGNLNNVSGRMVEAATDPCAATPSTSTITTDEWFSYDKDGNMTDVWELTPHSTLYYHSTATFFGNGQVNTVTLASPSLYTMTYGLDGEGRWSTLTDTTASQNIVTGTTFFPAANPAVVSLTGTTPDNDAYTFDTNTGNMTKFVFTVGDTPANLTGVLSWNPNGSLGKLAVTDGFNSGGTETCNSNSSGLLGAGYDDLERLVEFDCGSGNWGQQFAYDQYDNLTKTILSGRTGTTWNPGYSASTNHCTGCTYDSNGDVTGDSNDVYGWNEFSKIKWTATSGTPTCGTNGRCATYDAFGRMVEASVNSTWHTYWYTQAGKMVMTGTTPLYGRWPTSFGTVETVGTTCCAYLHNDWLGNSRIVSSTSNNTVTADQAYTPYGEIYNIFGANNGQYQVFADAIADLAPSTTTPIMWDTPNRELSYAGRWLSPDPAGRGWNQYAYATNPNRFVDPSGLSAVIPSNGSSGGVTFQNPVLFPDDPNTAGCTVDGLPTNCSEAYNLLQDGAISGGTNCDLFGCTTIATLDGVLQQVVGWKWGITYQGVDDNGEPIFGPGLGPIWEPYDPTMLAQGPANNPMDWVIDDYSLLRFKKNWWKWAIGYGVKTAAVKLLKPAASTVEAASGVSILLMLGSTMLDAGDPAKVPPSPPDPTPMFSPWFTGPDGRPLVWSGGQWTQQQ